MLSLNKNHTEIDLIQVNATALNIIRLDQNDPFVCGNKWLKLSLNITDQHERYATFGGPHSNHLHAFSYACKLLNKPHFVFVRGIGPKDTPTLIDIQNNQGQIIRLSKKDYAQKHDTQMQQRWQNLYGDMAFIPEGGDNELAKQGCQKWFSSLNLPDNAIVGVSIGTGCTFTGFARALKQNQTLVGLPAFYAHQPMIDELLASDTKGTLKILNAQNHERFAKMDDQQLNQMLAFEDQHKILLEPVYTGKTLFRLVEHYSKQESRPIYFIHTGGLQGRRATL
ncbi:hypothetical protein [Marinicellulosiphila megalodicopiae]|uniref:hypothetical protein n=1 Tax=Marinicellulosiphila megalodicopiae TaxID=2724896 RepID=UPI003BB0D80F